MQLAAKLLLMLAPTECDELTIAVLADSQAWKNSCKTIICQADRVPEDLVSFTSQWPWGGGQGSRCVSRGPGVVQG